MLIAKLILAYISAIIADGIKSASTNYVIAMRFNIIYIMRNGTILTIQHLTHPYVVSNLRLNWFTPNENSQTWLQPTLCLAYVDFTGLLPKSEFSFQD